MKVSGIVVTVVATAVLGTIDVAVTVATSIVVIVSVKVVK